nr:putative uncharacterized protein DDB_G0274535 isoform X2 [Drosophila kikkawai]XP_017037896.1 putative uncharacterized protein DDB_G0274535 isoform X2 [Drosophila kikkawai]
MAFSVEAHTSQARPKSESNQSNPINQESSSSICNNTPKSSSPSNPDRVYSTANSSNSNEKEYRKSQRYNIDDPGASTTTGNNIRGDNPGRAEGNVHVNNIPGSRGNGWRDKLVAQLLLLSEENKANGAYEGFAYFDDHHHTDRDRQQAKSQNSADQSTHKQQQQQKLQQLQRDRAQSASNSHYQNTLFTRVGTNASASQPGFACNEVYSKSDRFGDANPYRNVHHDWDCNIPFAQTNAGRFTDYGNGEPNGPGFDPASGTDPGVHGWYPADRCGRAAIPPGYEWSNAYCHS